MTIRPPHHPDVQLPYPTTFRPLHRLLSDPLHWNTPLRRAAYCTVACTFCTCARCNKRVALVLWVVNERFMHATLFTFNQNETWLFQKKNSCILNMQQGITKRTQINSSWMDTITSLVPVLQNMKTGNDGTECIEKQCAHNILPLPHTALIR